MNIELFSAAGGMAEGFRRAGIHFDLAFDVSPQACDSYAANLGHRPIQMDVADLLRMVEIGGARFRPIELLVADPPCTPWSKAGKRLGTEDERDMLEETVALIRHLVPERWLIANVPGLDDSGNWPTVQKTIGSLSAGARYWCIDFVRLDAANYGTPQHRVRPFWFGHAKDTPCIKWPEPTHCDPEDLRNETLPGMPKLNAWVTCRDALSHLSTKELGKPIRHTRTKKHPECSPDKPASTIPTGGSRHQGNSIVVPYRGKGKAWYERKSAEDAPARTVTTKRNSRIELDWPWDRPSTTVLCDDRLARPGHHPPAGGHRSLPGTILALSPRAGALLQGFPDGWVFAGKTKTARWNLIGQAMPPPLAEAVARSILEHMQRHP